jgi:hypothetical protein
METQVSKVLQFFLDGNTATTNKVRTKFKCRSPAYVIREAKKELERMGYSLKKWRKGVRGCTKGVTHYKMEVK